jgi:hypothetical protein
MATAAVAPVPDSATPVAEVLFQAVSRASGRRFRPDEFRLSETGSCPRYRVAKCLGLVDTTAEDPEGYLARGRVLEDWVAAEIRRHLGPAVRIRRQVPVRTRYGTGHIDIVCISRDTGHEHLVEVKTTQDRYLDDLPRAEHLQQVQAYLHFRPSVRTAELLYVIATRGLLVRSWPVRRNEAIGRTIEAELKVLAGYRSRRILPPIPDGYTPQGYPCSQCPFAGRCWGEAQSAAQPVDEEEAAAAAARLRQIEGILAEAKAQIQRLEEQRDRERDVLRAVLEAKGAQEIVAGGVRVRRTVVPGRRTLDVAGALAAGVLDEQALAPWWREGQPYERWTVR